MTEAARSEPALNGRLHPLSWVFGVLALLRHLLAPLLAVLVLGQKNQDWVFWAALPMSAAALWSVLQARVYRFEASAGELRLREGVLDRTQRHIPFARIHNITQRRHLLHRLLGVTELRLESAAGGKPEAVMKVLSLAAAAELEALLRGQAVAAELPADGSDAAMPASPVSAPRLLLSLPAREILLLGLSSNHGMVLVAALFGSVMQSEGLRKAFASTVGPLSRSLAHTLEAELHTQRWLHLGLLVLVMALIFMVLTRGLSVALAFLRYHGFRLELQGERLLSSRGLSTHVRAGARLPRLQRWELSSSWLQRRMGRVRLAVTVAGDNNDGEHHSSVEGAGRFSELAPLARPQQAQDLLQLCLPGLHWDRLSWQPLAPAAVQRRLLGLLRWLLPVMALLALADAVLGWWLPWPSLLAGQALVLGLSVLHARAWVARAAFAEAGSVLLYRSGVFTQRTVILSLPKVQSLRLYSSGLDRYLGLCHLQADTQGGSRARRALDMPCLDAAQARALLQRLWAGLSARP
ncbi:PH domain-containing protein [Paucibacter sp. DJ2R-2]|uniref:PH domain-containing protein n=1 Tax=Paucibacter sp. DJ2R-2 TaxID=2893558 RepID=UPI0021E41FC6|nr:PH domain-containing protein [Paucibacter sp. DJ2R-2]MCV2422992.1 PH domain-containing protein [Paucibacter sp. DJ4R-1]MCV2440888.1 PH domain-containing protein [Paucibacter sp. DJ2R-2]